MPGRRLKRTEEELEIGSPSSGASATTEVTSPASTSAHQLGQVPVSSETTGEPAQAKLTKTEKAALYGEEATKVGGLLASGVEAGAGLAGDEASLANAMSIMSDSTGGSEILQAVDTGVAGEVARVAGGIGALRGVSEVIHGLSGGVERDQAAHDLKAAKGNSKVDIGERGLEMASGANKTAGSIASSLGEAATAAEIAQVGGVLGAVTGAVDIGKGVNQAYKATNNKKGLRSKLAHNDAELAVDHWLGGSVAGKRGPSSAFLKRGQQRDQPVRGKSSIHRTEAMEPEIDWSDPSQAGSFATRADGGDRLSVMKQHTALAHMTEQQTKAQKEGAFKATTGALDVASGVATATGVGAAAGATIGAVSTGVKVGKMAMDYGVQKGRDSKGAGRNKLLAKKVRGTLEPKDEKKLEKQSKQKSRHKKAIRGQSMGFMEGARDATTLNTDASAENQAANKGNTADMILKTSGEEQLEYLGYLGINEATWKKMQATAQDREDPQAALKEMLISGQINI